MGGRGLVRLGKVGMGVSERGGVRVWGIRWMVERERGERME